ncbi:WXG100 family type VII secretion target [Nocardia spumae]|uniref:WXG100 family type VII secretion target n=1 Tax=Nocardia spumae TaxID=2887190 RepID=UPI001D134C6B|nr:WXG100 family type VII secretion target [Nocardia spumae]
MIIGKQSIGQVVISTRQRSRMVSRRRADRAGSYDHAVRIWNAHAHNAIGIIGIHRDRITDIEQRVGALQGTGWEGVAARAYDHAHREWMSGAREFVDGVREMSESAKEAHAAYSRALELNRQILDSADT